MCPSRRTFLGAGVAGLGLVGLTACGGGDDADVASVDAAAGDPLAALADVPVGGVLELDVDGRRVLLVQPTEGEVLAFDAECPHQGCSVQDDGSGGLECPCHGSTFDPADGAVLNGPATSGLTPVEVAVEGVDVVLL